MNPEYRHLPSALLAKVDQLGAGTESVVASPVATPVVRWAAVLRVPMIETQSQVEQNRNEAAGI
jgi:hypothetical protein